MESILDWWRSFWTHAQFWDAFWPAVWGALIGAAAATWLERRHRTKERISTEVGECNKLIFILGQMLSALEDINESLFESPRRKLGRAPEWNDIGALEGAPAEALNSSSASTRSSSKMMIPRVRRPTCSVASTLRKRTSRR